MDYSVTNTVAFLFDSTDPRFRGNYGDSSIKAVFDALIPEGLSSLPSTRIRVGDVLLHDVASRPVAFSVSPRPNGARSYTTSTTTWSADSRLLHSLAWHLLDSVEEQWHTTDLAPHLANLVQNGLFAVAFSTLPRDRAEQVDTRLKAAIGYLGAIEIDLGDPLQRSLFGSALVNEAILDKGELYTRSEDSETRIAPPWASDIDAAPSKVLLFAEFESYAPPETFPEAPSPSGVRLRELVEGVSGQSAHDHVLREIVKFADVVDERITGRVSVQLPSHGAPTTSAEVPRRKLTEYALSEQHPTGKHKARLFAELLGITAKDWRHLASQLLLGLQTAPLRTLKISDFGFGYSADIPVRGLNGKVYPVRTAWLSVDSEPPRLTTAYVAPDDAVVSPPDERLANYTVVETDDRGARYRKIYDLAVQAGAEASARCVPAPMLIEGHAEPIREGQCGWAGVHIIDGRSPFAGWLRRHGIGHKHWKRGWYIPAESGTQSVDRERAYAQAMRAVLLANGIIADIAWSLD